MIPIELKKRYPHSREEDITDAFMRGYQACAVQGGDAEMDNCQVQAPQNCMQQSRHDDGKDLISRADAIEAVRSYFKDRLGKSKCDYDEELQVYVLGKEERTMLTYNKGINDKLRSLPSADAEPKVKHDREWIIGCIKHDGFIKTDRFGKANQIILQIILDALSADRVGEWTAEIGYEGEVLYYECSNCKEAFSLLEGTPEENKYNYCPNCGARMKCGAE